MAQSTKKAKFRFNDKNFPILFEDGFLRIYKNPTNEIIIEEKPSGVTMRISSCYPDPGLHFTTGDRVEPVQVSGMIGWLITPRA